MDDTLKKLLSLAGSKDAALARAAAKVLGALRSAEPKVRDTLRGLLGHPDGEIAWEALSALSESAGPEILPGVVPLLSRGGALSQRAGSFVEKHAEEARPLLEKSLEKADPLTARAALALLPKSRGFDPAALLPVLLSTDAELAREATQTIRRAAEAIPEKRRGPFLAAAKRFSETKPVRANPEALTACVKILGSAAPTQDLGTFLAFSGKGYPARVRRNALFSLAKRQIPKAKAKPLAKTALAYLAEGDPAVAEAAAELLKKLPAEASWAKPLAKLAGHPGPARDFALNILGRLGGKAAFAALAPLTADTDREVRRRAASALARDAGNIGALIGKVDRKLANEAAWSLADALKEARDRFSEADKRKLRDRTLALLRKEDPSAEVLLAVAREVARQSTAEAVAKLAASQKDPARRADLLKAALKVDPDRTEARLELALTELKGSPKAMAPQARLADRALSAIAGVARADAQGTLAVLTRAKDLKPEDLYYIGFHCSEQPGTGDFGREALKLLVKRFPKHSLAAAAKNKAGL